MLFAATAAAAPLGPDGARCAAGGPAVLVHVEGLRSATGRLVAKLYRSDPETYLEKGTYIARVEVPAATAGSADICVPVARPGEYLVSVRHVVRAKKSLDDGGGISGNPAVSASDLIFQRKPPIQEISFAVAGSTRRIVVILSYLQNGAFRPIAE